MVNLRGTFNKQIKMNEAQLHLAFNHIPLIFPVAGMLILITGFLLKSELVKRIAYMIFIFGAVSAAFAVWSGEGAEEIAEKLPGVTDQVIHEHEEMAEKFALLSYILGALSLATLYGSWKRQSWAAIGSFIVLAAGAVGLFLAQQTGHTGGQIRHTEIRSGFNAQDAGGDTGGENQNAAEENEADED